MFFAGVLFFTLHTSFSGFSFHPLAVPLSQAASEPLLSVPIQILSRDTDLLFGLVSHDCPQDHLVSSGLGQGMISVFGNTPAMKTF